MKYGYKFMDWGLWEIEELLEVKELEEDLITRDCFGEHIFTKDQWVWAKSKDPIFCESTYDGKHIHTTMVCEGPYLKSCIFDTKEAAEEYAREHSHCFFF